MATGPLSVLEEAISALEEEENELGDDDCRRRWEDLGKQAVKCAYRVKSHDECLLLFGGIIPRVESHLGERIAPTVGIPLNLEQREFRIPPDEVSFEMCLSKLEEELTELENQLRTDLSEDQRTKLMERMNRVYDRVKSKEEYCEHGLYPRGGFLLSLVLPRFEPHLKERLLMERDNNLQFAKIKEQLVSEIQANGGDGMLWKYISFPVDPDYYEISYQIGACRSYAFKNLGRVLQSTAEEEHPFEFTNDVVSRLDVDVLSLLTSSGGCLIRNNGDLVVLNRDTFKGKHVMVCCFNVPLLTWISQDFQSLVNLCRELHATRRDEFEMVMVARMNSLANDEEVFNHFFSGFPESCLAVPFDDNQRRDSICKVLGLGPRHDDFNFKCVFLNAEGQVMPLDAGLWTHGAEAFPFTESMLDKMYDERRKMVFENKELETVLKCDASSPDYVYRGSRDEVMPISRLAEQVKAEDGHVGIYLCEAGSLMPNLQEMYGKCREAGLKFEIVVINMPFNPNTDPEIHEKRIDRWMQEHGSSGVWWRLPFNNSVSCRFSELTEMHDIGAYGSEPHDKLMVVGPRVDHLDMYGAQVMLGFGIEAFPFTINAAVRMERKQLQKMKPNSSFSDSYLERLLGFNDYNDHRMKIWSYAKRPGSS